MMNRIAEQLALFEGEFELWLSISTSASYNDAVYIHSPNPHSNFPVDFSSVSWDDTAVPDGLKALGDSGLACGFDEVSGYVAFRPGVGVDLRISLDGAAE